MPGQHGAQPVSGPETANISWSLEAQGFEDKGASPPSGMGVMQGSSQQRQASPPTCDMGRGPWRWRGGPRSPERGPRSQHLMVSRSPACSRLRQPRLCGPGPRPAPYTCHTRELLALPSTGFLPDDGGDAAQRQGWARRAPASPAPPPGSGRGPGLSAPFRHGSPLPEPTTRPAGARAKGSALGALPPPRQPLGHSQRICLTF